MIGIASELISLGATWIKGKQEKAKVKAEAEATAMKTAATSRADWERLMAKGAANSWKDELWTVILAAPLFLAFIPGGQEVAAQGFQTLETMPEYYRYMLGLAVSASFGVKGWKQFVAR